MAFPTRPLGIKLAAASSPRVALSLYMDPFCPFCSRIWQRLDAEVLPWIKAEKDGDVSVTMFLLPQPWHPQSAFLCEGALAVQEQSEAAVVPYLRAVWDPATRSQWGDDATYTMSRSEIYDAIGKRIVKDLDGVDTAAWRARMEPLADGGVGVTGALKQYVKHGRLLGIHVSPTCVTNGIRDDSVSSGWTLDQWKAYIAKVSGDDAATA